MDRVPSREEAWNLLGEYVRSEGLRCHALAVEAVMRHAARKRGQDEEAWGVIGLVTDVEPRTDLEKTLYAVDELTGLVAAAALVRPSKSLLDLPVKSVMKKWKDKAFAAGVDRSVIEKGAAMLGVEIPDLVADTIEGMRAVADRIGLKGTP